MEENLKDKTRNTLLGGDVRENQIFRRVTTESRKSVKNE